MKKSTGRDGTQMLKERNHILKKKVRDATSKPGNENIYLPHILKRCGTQERKHVVTIKPGNEKGGKHLFCHRI